MRQIENNQFVRQSPQRTSQRMYTPPSPSLRRVTSEPPPIPPRTPESQRKPLLVRLASEPVVDGLDFQQVNGRVVVKSSNPSPSQQQQQQQHINQFEPKPPPGKPSPPVAGPAGGFRFSSPLRPPALPPRPPPSSSTQQQQQNSQQASPSEETQPAIGKGFVIGPSRVINPPTDLPGLPPRPPPSSVDTTAADRNSSSSVARLAQMFGTQLSPAR